MAIVYRKSAKGVAEISTRALRLAPRLRNALILVDGRKSDAELARLILTEPAATLNSLLGEGFIEVVTPAPDAPAQALAASVPAPLATAVDGAAFEALRHEAVLYLSSRLGPAAQALAVDLEGASSMSELRPLLAQGAQLLLVVHGIASAEAFMARFAVDPDA